MDDPSVIGEGVRVDKDIIHITYHLTVVDELMENIIHHHLECCRRVTQSKEHDGWFEQPSVSSEHGLPLVSFLDPHVVESPQRLSMVKNSVSQRRAKTFERKWGGEGV